MIPDTLELRYNLQFKMNKLPLNVREWACPKCMANHDRDVNAAINILSAAFYRQELSITLVEGF